MLKKMVIGFVAIFYSAGLLAIGFNDGYEVRVGAYTGTAEDDLYISRPPDIILLHGDIVTPIVISDSSENFVLENNGNGTFTLRDNLTNQQHNQFSEWDINNDIEINIADLNADGYLDIFLSDVVEVVTSAYDQIVYADMSDNIAPQALAAVTPDFEEFFTDISSWLVNESYFFDNAVHTTNGTKTVTQTFWVLEWCSNGQYTEEELAQFAGPAQPVSSPISGPLTGADITAYWLATSCSSAVVFHFDYVTYSWQEAVITSSDYSGFNQDAWELVDDEYLPNILDLGELYENTGDVLVFSSVLSDILGVDFMGGVLAQSGSIVLPGEDIFDIPTIRKYRLRFSFVTFLIEILEALFPNEEALFYLHYTDNVGKDGIIGDGGFIESFREDNKVFFSDQLYPTGGVAQSCNATNTKPTVYFLIPNWNVPDIFYEGKASPNGIYPGGGREWTHQALVNANIGATGTRYIDLLDWPTPVINSSSDCEKYPTYNQ